MRVALVHDYLIDYGGAERVLLALHELFPQAPIFTLIVDKGKMGRFWEKFEGADIRTSWFNSWPFSSRLISPLRFLIPILWSSFDLKNFDLIISSSSWAITKGFGGGDPSTSSGHRPVEICYVHTPPRYLYGYETSRIWQGKWYGRLVDFYALLVNHFMRQYDFARAQKVDYFITNSKNVAERIKKFYKRDAVVIYPPIDLPNSKSQASNPKQIQNTKYEIVNSRYFLAGGRLVSSKNFDLIVKACKKMNVRLKVFGSGPEEDNLKSLGDQNTEFVGKVGDKELAPLYQNARAFVVAQRDEDFGMTVLEANAYGCPVVAFRGGGYLETVVERKTGLFFNELVIDSLVSTLKQFDSIKWNSSVIKKHAQKFSKERFKREIQAFVESKL